MPDLHKTALITGVNGQDGACLAELLLEKGYVVHGVKSRASLFNTDRIDHLYQDPHVEHPRFVLHCGDLTDSSNLIRILGLAKKTRFHRASISEPGGLVRIDARRSRERSFRKVGACMVELRLPLAKSCPMGRRLPLRVGPDPCA